MCCACVCVCFVCVTVTATQLYKGERHLGGFATTWGKKVEL